MRRARRRSSQLLGPALLVVAVGLVAATASPRERDLVPERARLRRDRRRAVRVRRQLGRALVRPDQLRRRRRVRRRRDDGPARVEESVLPSSSRSCATTRRERAVARCSPPLAGGIFAFVVGMPLMRLSGLAAGIATFAVLEITHNMLRYWTKIGPGPTTLSLGARDDRAAAGDDRRAGRDRGRVRLPAQPLGRMLRATREDPRRGRRRRRRRPPPAALAFTLSGALAGFAGGLSSTSSARSRPTRSTSTSRS